MSIKRSRILSKKEREIIVKRKEEEADADYGTTTEMIGRLPITCLIVSLFLSILFPIFMFLGWLLYWLGTLI